MVNLTDITIRSLPTPERGQKDYFDEGLAGFGVRVSQGGSRSFFLFVGAKQNRERISIGRYPIIKLAEARTEAKRILAERTLGKHRPKAISFTQAVEEFLAEKTKSRRARTVKDYKRLLNVHFAFGGQLTDFSHADFSRRLERIKGGSERNHALAAAKTFFTWAHKKRYITDDPTIGLTLHDRPSRSRVLDDHELKAVWKAADLIGGHFGSIVKLLILTGQRRGEIAAFRASWIKEGMVALPASLAKNGREHFVPLGEIAQSITATTILSSSDESAPDYLFPARGNAKHSFSGWSKGKETLDALSGVTGWTLHDVRRTVATNLAQLGVAPHVVEKLLNHVSGTISGVAAIYNKFEYRDEMRAALNMWEHRLQALLA